MIEINYNNTIPEIKRGYTLFTRKYKVPRMFFMTILFGITFYLGIDFIIKGQGFAGYALTVISAGLIIARWTDPLMKQRRIVSAIEAYGSDEKYTARFYDDRIEIDTEVIPSDAETEIVAITKNGVTTVENPEVLEEAEKQLIQAETSVYKLGAEALWSVEDSELFCLFVNKALIHIFPKRCLSEEQTESLRNYFREKQL